MNKRFSLLFAALIITFGVSAQGVLSEAKYHIALKESSSAAQPIDSKRNVEYESFAGQDLPAAVKDPQRGSVRKFIARKTSIVVKPVVVYGTSARSYSFWAKPDTKVELPSGQIGAQNGAVPLKAGNMADPKAAFLVQITQGGFMTIAASNKLVDAVKFKSNVPLLDSWHHYTITVADGAKASEVKCYIDGVLLNRVSLVEATGADDFVFNTARVAMFVAPQFGGLMSDVVIFDRELSPAEVTTLMNETK